ncbi:MAG: ORF6N domain-containing protein [Bacteriovoracaceae bacterium]|nr:ORF6N domain-containing protein [Bacteriovoracaceae bacterium]
MPFQLEKIQTMIYMVNGQKVMLDSDLAKLYQVDTKVLNQAVRRNIKRFPEDFMFQLSVEQYENLRSQFVTSTSKHGGKRYQPLVFTENGIAMLSSVLRSETAIEVNIAIMRIFTKLRSFHALESRVDRKIEMIERDVTKTFKIVFQRLDEIQDTRPSNKKNKIGLKNEDT